MIDYFNLKKHDEEIATEIQNAVSLVVSSGKYILGEQLNLFEHNYARYCGTRYASGVANGLDALTLIFRALDINGMIDKRKPILIPENTFLATVLSAFQAEFIVELYKITDDFRIDFDYLNSLNTNAFSLIVFVPLYGNYTDANRLQEWSKQRNLYLVEDAAQAHGARKGTIKAGNIGIASSFSFYPGKNLGCYGDGGAITTNDENLINTIKKLRNYGFSEKYKAGLIGVNSRLDEIQASILNIKLLHLDKWNEKRYLTAQNYSKYIKNTQVILPNIPKNKFEHVFHIFPVRVKNHEAFEIYLQSFGIQTSRHYPIHLSDQKCFSVDGVSWKKWHISDELISLPCGPELTDDQQSKIIDACNRFT